MHLVSRVLSLTLGVTMGGPRALPWEAPNLPTQQLPAANFVMLGDPSGELPPGMHASIQHSTNQQSSWVSTNNAAW